MQIYPQNRSIFLKRAYLSADFFLASCSVLPQCCNACSGRPRISLSLAVGRLAARRSHNPSRWPGILLSNLIYDLRHSPIKLNLRELKNTTWPTKRFHSSFIKILLKWMVAFDKNEGHTPAAWSKAMATSLALSFALIHTALKWMVAFDKKGHVPSCLKQGDGDGVGVVLHLDSQCGGTVGLQTKTTEGKDMLARMQKKCL